MRTSVLGPGNWSKIAKEEADLDRRRQEQREARIGKVAQANFGDSEFTFATLCERFSESDPTTIKRILRERCRLEVASDGLELRPIDSQKDQKGTEQPRSIDGRFVD